MTTCSKSDAPGLHLRWTLSAAVAGAAALAFSPAAQADLITTLVVEETASTERGNDNAYDVPWYRTVGGSFINREVQWNEPGDPSWIRFRPYGSQRQMVGTLYTSDGSPAAQAASVTLGTQVGDAIRLSTDFKLINATGNTGNAALQIGLYNSNGDLLTSDQSPTWDQDGITGSHYGYFASVGIGEAGASLGSEAGTDDRLLEGADLDDLTDSSNPVALDDEVLYGITFELTRLAGGAVGLNLTVSGDGNVIGSASGIDESGVFETFDEIVFGAGNANPGFLLVDNVRLETVVIPEPTTAALAGLAALSMLSRRRRH